uniref:Uncharacterized protein n=1 Tax=Anguilla anguilla TaxID=7936 RepID=A0A0E9TJT6_ANGAN
MFALTQANIWNRFNEADSVVIKKLKEIQAHIFLIMILGICSFFWPS